MPKRKLSKGIPCPGCQTKFDTETHAPFVGSCGHSVCAVCVHQKEKIKTCPVCDKGKRFKLKKRNELAIELLASKKKKKVKKAKKPKMTPKFEVRELSSASEQVPAILDPFLAEIVNQDSKKANLDVEEAAFSSEEPIPAILDSNNRHFLEEIVNQLDHKSFLTLSRTCKALHKYCFNTKDVKITDNISIISIRGEDGFLVFQLEPVVGFEYSHDDRCGTYLPLDNLGYKNGLLSSSIGRKMLQKYPFVFNLELLHCRQFSIDSEFYLSLRSFFSEFPIQKIIRLDTYSSILEEWNGSLQFLKDFHVEFVEMTMDVNVLEEMSTDLMKEAFTYLLQNLKGFEYDHEIDERLILDATVPQLKLEYTSISKNTFLDLIPNLADLTGEIDWFIGCQTPFDFDYQTLSSFNVKPFDYKGPVPDDRPLLFIKDDEHDGCWLLRNDGKVLKCHKNGRCIFISMCPSREYPRCLRRRRNSRRD